MVYRCHMVDSKTFLEAEWASKSIKVMRETAWFHAELISSCQHLRETDSISHRYRDIINCL